MAEIILRTYRDPATGQKVVDIKYDSDSDALPVEHEQDHRAIVDKVLEGADRGKLVIHRPAGAPTIVPEEQANVQGEALTEKK